MGNFRPGGRSFGKKSFGGKSFSRGGDRPMFDAVCSKCGDDCQIPFRATGDRPVFCSNCFEKQGPASTSGKFGGNSFKRSDRDEKQMFEAVCATCGNECEVPFRPSGGKPVYCRECFSKNDAGPRGRGDSGSKDQFIALNNKLDRILAILGSHAYTEISKEKKEKKDDKKGKEVVSFVEEKQEVKEEKTVKSKEKKKPVAKKKEVKKKKK
ncbi:MAG: CxxC-x17-CxxC domain-containing protein [Candidatus Magasanikbacteria bacterium]